MSMLSVVSSKKIIYLFLVNVLINNSHIQYISNSRHQAMTLGYFLRSDSTATLPADSEEALGPMQGPRVCRRRS